MRIQQESFAPFPELFRFNVILLAYLCHGTTGEAFQHDDRLGLSIYVFNNMHRHPPMALAKQVLAARPCDAGPTGSSLHQRSITVLC